MIRLLLLTLFVGVVVIIHADNIDDMRENGPNRDIRIFLKNQMDDITTAKSYIHWGRGVIPPALIVLPGDSDSTGYFTKDNTGASGISGVFTYSLGDSRQSYAAIVFSVPFTRLFSCNWYGVHIVNRPADESMFHDLMGRNGSYATATKALTTTDGVYSVKVVMNHPGQCDLHVTLEGTRKPPFTAPAIKTLIGKLLQYYLPGPETEEFNISLELQVINGLDEELRIRSYVRWGVAAKSRGSRISPNTSSAHFVHQKQGVAAGTEGILELRTNDWNKEGYKIVIYWDLPIGWLKNNHFGIMWHEKLYPGEEVVNLYNKHYSRNGKSDIWVHRRHLNFGFVMNQKYVVLGEFPSAGNSRPKIVVFKVDRADEGMKYLFDKGDIDKLTLCDSRKGCSHHGESCPKGR